jgi:hypothetical protein
VYGEDVWKLVTGVYDTDKSRKQCKECRETFNSHHQPYVAQTTWFIHFPIGTVNTANHATRLQDLPTIITLPELRTGQEVSFQLGFVQYTNYHPNPRMVSHVTSVHYIGRDYFYYDSMRDGGALHPLGEEDPRGGEARFAYYFRR